MVQDDLVEQVVALAAEDAPTVDREGAFPERAVAAARDAGLLALTVPQELGGGGEGLGAAADLVRRLSIACGSTAMVVGMHYAATALLVAAGHETSLKEIAAARHLTTLAFSETGSRSHFWAPVSTATSDGDEVVLDAQKSWVTAAHHADSYVWSSRPLAAEGPMTLWFVRSGTPGLDVPRGFDGLGLRGNDSCPMTATGARVSSDDLLGRDGEGLDQALAVVLPVFLVVNAAAGVGLMQAVTAATTAHLTTTRLQHLDETLAQQLPGRARLAKMQIETDRTWALVRDASSAVDDQRPEAGLRVLEAKAAADEAAAAVADLAMLTCGGAAFRKELPIERRFRDSRAARVMAPTTDALHDFIGRALCGLPLLGPA